jgi:tetratricopeptide (TPR) repeat protein
MTHPNELAPSASGDSNLDSKRELLDPLRMIDFDAVVSAMDGASIIPPEGIIYEPSEKVAKPEPVVAPPSSPPPVGTTWAELLRNRQGDSVPIGSIPDIHIDAVSDKDLVRQISRESGLIPTTLDPSESGVLDIGAAGLPLPGDSKVVPMAAAIRPGVGDSDIVALGGSPPPSKPASDLIDFMAGRVNDGDSRPSRNTAVLPPDEIAAGADEVARAAMLLPTEMDMDYKGSLPDDGSAVNLSQGLRKVVSRGPKTPPPARRRPSSTDEDLAMRASPLEPEPSSAVNLGLDSATREGLIPGDSIAAVVGNDPRAGKPRSRPDTALPRRRGASMLGAGLVGAMAVGGMLTGIWYSGALPLSPGQRARLEVVTAPANIETPPAPTPAPADTAGVAVEAASRLLETGDAAAALRMYEKCEPNPEVLTGRGQSRWLAYLKQQRQAKEALNGNAAEIADARTDLRNANTPEATLWLGLIEETLGDRDAARTIYRKGMQDFPTRSRLFQTAQDRLDSLSTPKPPAAKPDAGARRGAIDPTLGMALFILLTQADGESDPDEPGFAFWEALKLARRHDYATARTALVKAREIHDARRLATARRGPNPHSDPMDQMFLSSCDELLGYWDLKARLHGNGYPLDQHADAASAVNAILKSKTKLETTIKTLNSEIDALNTRLASAPPDVRAELKAALAARDSALTEQKRLAADLAKYSSEKTALDEARTKAMAELRTLSDQLARAGFDGTDHAAQLSKLVAAHKAAEDRVAKTAELLVAANSRADESAKALVQLTAARKDADETLRALTDKLRGAKLIGVKASHEDLLKAVDSALGNAGDAAVKHAEIARMRELLAVSRTPSQMLNFWPAILEANRGPDVAKMALSDVASALKEANGSAEVKARAIAVQGLAHLANDDYAPARKLLAEAIVHPDLPKNSNWSERVRRAEASLADSRAILIQVRALIAVTNFAEAKGQIERGLIVFPKATHPRDHGLLLVARSEMQFAQKQPGPALTDANAAIESGVLAEGHIAAAAAAAALGQFNQARSHYQQAHRITQDPNDKIRVGLALARLLTTPEAAEADLATALQLAQQAGGVGAADVHLIKARILARENRVMEALEESLKGLKVLAPPGMGDGWDKLLHQIPKQVVAAAPPTTPRVEVAPATPPIPPEPLSPEQGDRYFGVGVHYYFAGQYYDAISVLTTATRLNGRDARYHYFLGLSQAAVGQHDQARASFVRGANLEQLGMPDSRQVNALLERIQGYGRVVLNQYRR